MVSATQRLLCEHCGVHQRHGKRRFCSNCYRAGVRRGLTMAAKVEPGRPICPQCDERFVKRTASGYAARCFRCRAGKPATIPPIERPENLVDTGMRIIDSRGVVVYPSGRRRRVPPTFVFDFFFEAVTEDRDGLPLILRVLRVAKETANVHA